MKQRCRQAHHQGLQHEDRGPDRLHGRLYGPHLPPQSPHGGTHQQAQPEVAQQPFSEPGVQKQAAEAVDAVDAHGKRGVGSAANERVGGYQHQAHQRHDHATARVLLGVPAITPTAEQLGGHAQQHE